MLTEALYDISLTPVAAENDEVWHPDVVRVDCTHKETGFCGVIYMDLFARPTKNGHPSHYCVRSSKESADGTKQYPAIALVRQQ